MYIEDSTCIKLSDDLAEDFPGNGYWGKGSNKAILKIQATYNLFKQNFARFEITNFRKNDQSYSKQILELAKRGDLIIRDLGYFVLKVFRELNTSGIFYISRLRKDVRIYSADGEELIDLAKILKKTANKYPGCRLDMQVILGEEERLPARIIAIPVADDVAGERRRKARTNRDSRVNPSKASIYLLGWELFVTNVSKQQLSAEDISAVYFIRWRIEIIFKCWKSYFKMTAIPRDADKIRVESYIYCMLIFILLFQVSFYIYCREIMQSEDSSSSQNELSSLLLTQYIANNITTIWDARFLDDKKTGRVIMTQISYYCRYDCRYDRQNYYQKLNNLG